MISTVAFFSGHGIIRAKNPSQHRVCDLRVVRHGNVSDRRVNCSIVVLESLTVEWAEQNSRWRGVQPVNSSRIIYNSWAISHRESPVTRKAGTALLVLIEFSSDFPWVYTESQMRRVKFWKVKHQWRRFVFKSEGIMCSLWKKSYTSYPAPPTPSRHPIRKCMGFQGWKCLEVQRFRSAAFSNNIIFMQKTVLIHSISFYNTFILQIFTYERKKKLMKKEKE